MAELNKKLKAATLIEAIVAMIIIVSCLGLAVMIYENVLSSDKQLNKQKAFFILNDEAAKTKAAKLFIDEKKEVGTWTIDKTISKYKQTENLYELKLVLSDKNGNLILTRDELINKE